MVLDAWIGDPVWPYHPVRLIGRVAMVLESFWRRLMPKSERLAGVFFGLSVLAIVAASVGGLYLLPWVLRLPIEAAVTYFCLAYGCLFDETLAVVDRLKEGDLTGARRRLRFLVSRDVSRETESGLARAAIETTTENMSDGIVAPLFWFAVGGAPAALVYKAVNTLDSMVGYRNEKYERFGWFCARLDDVANYVPARLTGLIMVFAAAVFRRDYRGAWRAWRRDAQKGPSPNGGIPIVVFAGAEGLVLGGDCLAGDGSVVRVPTVGEGRTVIGYRDVHLALMYLSAVTLFAFGVSAVVVVLT